MKGDNRNTVVSRPAIQGPVRGAVRPDGGSFADETPHGARTSGAQIPRSATLRISRARAVVQKHPHSAEAYLSLAKAAASFKPSAEAGALRRALQLDPGSTTAFRMLSDLYQQTGYIDRKIELLRSWIAGHPGDADALLQASSFEEQLADPVRARALVNQALRLAPDNPKSLQAEIMLDYAEGKPGRSIPLLKAAIRGSSKPDQLWYQLSELDRAAGQYGAAETAIRRAINLNPSDGQYFRQLAHILVTSSKPQRLPDAEAAARKAIALGDHSTDAEYWLASALDRKGKLPEAIRAYEAIAHSEANYEMTSYRLGRLYERVGRAKEAQAALRLYGDFESNRSRFAQAIRSLRNHPEQSQNYMQVAHLYALTDRPGLAIALLRRAVRRFPLDRKLRGQLRDTLSNAGRRTEASAIARGEAS